MNLLIVSGLSGSGKTIALQALEDLGLYCVDNLPAGALPSMAKHISSSTREHGGGVAFGIDVRNRSFLDKLPESLKQLDSDGVNYQIIFLEAEESILVKRFKETRRKHPMIDSQTSLLEGIELERNLLEPLSFNADLRMDTSHKTPSELRQQIQDFIQANGGEPITLLFESFGFKRGTPLDADYVFDVRCLPNPYWQPELRAYSGLDEPVIEFMRKQKQAGDMCDGIKHFLDDWLPSFIQEKRAYMTIAIGCTGGVHRSIYIAEQLGAYFTEKGYHVLVRHREKA